MEETKEIHTLERKSSLSGLNDSQVEKKSGNSLHKSLLENNDLHLPKLEKKIKIFSSRKSSCCLFIDSIKYNLISGILAAISAAIVF